MCIVRNQNSVTNGQNLPFFILPFLDRFKALLSNLHIRNKEQYIPRSNIIMTFSKHVASLTI
ncbi:hypothetical protein PR048_007993 [Dryococelus australis]|uniref:Uncharacterized protein n=1 Tax=Dryococelus australis TaxID=614101 RepID=A0ABQ9HW60_9NEOP|nr:hypothetical protein PR048_007993 [Dryococelus australis]